MGRRPLVTVLMPVYNGELYLAQAIESILKQTFGDFEFVIINDGSTDGTEQMLEEYRHRDGRIRIHHQGNRGLGDALNTGLELAQGLYVARMDADDRSQPQRLAKQVAFMDAHPGVSVCGTWVKTTGDAGGDVWRYPTDDGTIRCRLLFESVLAHPSVIMRSGLFTETGLDYRLEYSPCEDYDLWVRASAHCRFSNLPEVLLLRRLHGSQLTQRDLDRLSYNSSRVRLAQLGRLGLQPSPEEVALHQRLSMWEFQATNDFLIHTDTWLRKIQVSNRERSIYPEPEFSRVLGERWFRACRVAANLGWWTWRAFWRSPLSRELELSLKESIKFGLKCAIRHGR